METATSAEDLAEVQMALGGGGLGTGAVAGVGAGGGSAASASVVFSNGASYFGTRDAQISSTSPATNFGQTTSCASAGGEVARSCLIKWDLSSVPANAIVDFAYVRLDVHDGSVATFDIHQVNGAWEELSVNWTQRDATHIWTGPGCNSTPSDRTSAPVARFVGTSGLRTITLNGLGPAMIQNWLVNPSANKGIIIRNATGTLDSLGVHSSNYSVASLRPTLGFTYHLP
ncbi:MAG: DNRLRE domain-containing protein [Myxococcales bacterium]